MRFAALAAIVFISTVPAFGAGADSQTAIIDVGRLGAMMDRSEDALKILVPTVRDSDMDTPAAQRAFAFQQLVSAVLRFNLIAAEACRSGIAAPKVCAGAPYLPPWLKDAPESDRSDAQLDAMIADANAHLEPLWRDICAKGQKVSGDDTFCDLE
jgi:hypothetical protein